jgi:hypothetical protein
LAEGCKDAWLKMGRMSKGPVIESLRDGAEYCVRGLHRRLTTKDAGRDHIAGYSDS